MPSKRHTDASLTIRLGKEIKPLLPIEALADIIREESNFFIIGCEYSDSANIQTEHYHIAARLKKDQEISKTFKAKIINKVQEVIPCELSPDNLKHGFDIKYHNDFNYYVGYCTKQDLKPYYEGMETSYVDSCREYYYGKSKKIQQKIPVGRSAYLELLRSAYDELWSKVISDNTLMDKFEKSNVSKKLILLERILINRGYDLTCISPTQKREVLLNFDSYIVRNAEGGQTIEELLDSL